MSDAGDNTPLNSGMIYFAGRVFGTILPIAAALLGFLFADAFNEHFGLAEPFAYVGGLLLAILGIGVSYLALGGAAFGAFFDGIIDYDGDGDGGDGGD